MGFHRTVFTQAGYSFLFLLLENHKDIFCHSHHGVQASLRKKHCNDNLHLFYHHIPAVQISHHTDTTRTLHPYHASFLYFPSILHLWQSGLIRESPVQH